MIVVSVLYHTDGLMVCSIMSHRSPEVAVFFHLIIWHLENEAFLRVLDKC